MITSNEEMKKRVVFMGLIGAGKTTCAELLSQKTGLPLEREDVENKTLKLFYQDMKRYSFVLQFSLLAMRYLEYLNGAKIHDRSVHEDLAFCYSLVDMGNMTEEELVSYREVRNIILEKIKSNDKDFETLYIYLKISPEKCIERIRMRQRSMETGITLEYMRLLSNSYERMMNEFDGAFLEIDGTLPPDEVVDIVLRNYQQKLSGP